MAEIEEIIKKAGNIKEELDSLEGHLRGHALQQRLSGIIGVYDVFVRDLDSYGQQAQLTDKMTPSHQYNEFLKRFNENRVEMDKILRGTQSDIERDLSQIYCGLDIRIEWVDQFAFVLGIQNYESALLLPRAGAHFRRPLSDWFKLPHGINISICGIVEPGFVEGYGTSIEQYKFIKLCEAKQ